MERLKSAKRRDREAGRSPGAKSLSKRLLVNPRRRSRTTHRSGSRIHEDVPGYEQCDNGQIAVDAREVVDRCAEMTAVARRMANIAADGGETCEVTQGVPSEAWRMQVTARKTICKAWKARRSTAISSLGRERNRPTVVNNPENPQLLGCRRSSRRKGA